MSNVHVFNENSPLLRLHYSLNDVQLSALPGHDFSNLVAAYKEANEKKSALGHIACNLAKSIIILMNDCGKHLYQHHFFDAFNKPQNLLVEIAETYNQRGSSSVDFDRRVIQAINFIERSEAVDFPVTVAKALKSFLLFYRLSASEQCDIISKSLHYLRSVNALDGFYEQPVRKDICVCINSGNFSQPDFVLRMNSECKDFVDQLKLCGAIWVIEQANSTMNPTNSAISHYVFYNEGTDKPAIMDADMMSCYTRKLG
ncbi:hypothetical protein OH460_08395 [Vibrio sp. Makdt]|uniref:hypothetical protein n=1 Tax=Vibrio sp. Makdt TaxID=2998828 RepID=UPI0022CD2487|nr:hypothetical protein [Vibrio sp. Makdt]MDA0152319.1 hypothetical protein [Vibrio sp. Makdt]